MFLLLHGFLLTSSPSLFTLNWKSAFSLQRSFGGKSSWARIWSHLLCLCVICMGNCSWFTDGKLWFTDDDLVIGGEVYVARKRKLLDDVIGGYQAYIKIRERKIYLFISLEFGSWLRPRAVSRLRARFACDKIIMSRYARNEKTLGRVHSLNNCGVTRLYLFLVSLQVSTSLWPAL